MSMNKSPLDQSRDCVLVELEPVGQYVNTNILTDEEVDYLMTEVIIDDDIEIDNIVWDDDFYHESFV